MTDIYVYYRVHAGAQQAARAAVATIFTALRQSTGVRGRLTQRVDDPLTWMESYLEVTDTDAFEPALARALAASGLTECVNGERHMEYFAACV